MCAGLNFLKIVSFQAQRRYFSQRTKGYLFSMNKAYLRQCEDGQHFEFTFEYKQEEPTVKRVFNFSRKLSEDVNTFLTRVSSSVEKVVSKKKKRKKSPEVPTETSPSIETLLVQDNVEIPRSNVCGDIFLPNTKLVLCINDKKYNIVVNSPWIESLELPDSIIADFPVYPIKFETQFTNKELSEFLWYKSTDKTNWTQVGNDYIYIPSNSDINHYLKLTCTPKNEDSDGPMVESVSSCQIQAGPGECPFQRRHAFTKQRATGKEFRVMSYNLLADLYCDSDYTREVLFPYCPPYALNINYRKQLFMKEIIGYNSDIICLQEVDKKVFTYDLEPTLSHYNYSGSLTLKGSEVAEGLAFFYNNQRFIHLDYEKLVFSERLDKEPVFADIYNKISENSKFLDRIKARSTTLQVNVLGSLEHDEILLVANIHLYFHPDSDHIRLIHGCLAIKYLENMAAKLRERYLGKRVSLIFCGDFNSVPSCGIYKLFTTGFVPGNFVDYSSNEEEKIENVDVHQSFKLGSACGTPKYTNFTVLFADCLDYIYYDKSSLEVRQVVPLPSDEELTQNSAIPSVVFPSDHIALVSDLKWIEK